MNRDELKLLGYTEKWVNAGILTPERLLNDLQEDRAREGDPDREHLREHYRRATLYEFIEKKKALTDNEINDILEIAHDDEDKTMLFGVVFVLIESRTLTDVQFESLQTHPHVQLFKTSRVYKRQKLFRAIDREGLTATVIAECMTKGDGQVHRRLLEMELDQKILVVLSEKGANKTVRNMANTRLKQHKYVDTNE